jgi:ribokinase
VERIREFGVGVEKVEYVEEKTGRAIIQVADNGENSIVLFKGANYHKRIPTPADLVPRPTHLVVQNEIPLESTIEYLTIAHQDPNARITTVFNPSPLPTEEEIRSFPWDKVSWLIVNEGEAEDLLAVLDSSYQSPSGSQENDVERASAILERLYTSLGSTSTNIVLTLGSTGVTATYGPHNTNTKSSWRPVFVPSIQLRGEVRDTTGAGDCFTGYFVAELMKVDPKKQDEIGEMEMKEMLSRCVVAAGMCCEKEGTLDSVPLREDVEARMKEV